MITPQPPGFEHLTDAAAIDRDRRRRASNARRTSGRQKVATATSIAPAFASVARDLQHVRASWTSENGRFDLVVGSDANGLQVKQCSWLRSGAALEERFLIHTLDEFEQWFAKAPTKFDHPVAHEEVRRFAHGILCQ